MQLKNSHPLAKFRDFVELGGLTKVRKEFYRLVEKPDLEIEALGSKVVDLENEVIYYSIDEKHYHNEENSREWVIALHYQITDALDDCVYTAVKTYEEQQFTNASSDRHAYQNYAEQTFLYLDYLIQFSNKNKLIKKYPIILSALMVLKLRLQDITNMISEHKGEGKLQRESKLELIERLQILQRLNEQGEQLINKTEFDIVVKEVYAIIYYQILPAIDRTDRIDVKNQHWKLINYLFFMIYDFYSKKVPVKKTLRENICKYLPIRFSNYGDQSWKTVYSKLTLDKGEREEYQKLINQLRQVKN